MNVFRFCRWSLAALPVFFMLVACDKLLPTSGNGELVPVKIRSVSVKGYGEASATRSAGGEKRIVQEPVIQDLGGGMLAEITVEEDVLALRDDEGTNLSDDANYRVIVLDSEGKYVTHNDFTPQSDNREVTLEENGTYTFICFSRNSSDELPTVNYAEGQELPDFSTGITDGELYWESKTVEVSGDAGLSFLLRPQFAKVTLKLNGNGKTITDIADNSISLNAASSGNFNLAEGEFSSSGSINFSGWTPAELGVQEVTSGEVTFIPQAKYTFSFAAEAISWEDDATTGKTTEGPIGSFKFTFKPGKNYTVTLTILRLPRFAGSNIYWDGSQLTFDPYGINNDHAKYQGVYFRWGSLIGVAAGKSSESYTAGSTILYKPTNTSDPVGTARTWEETADDDDAWNGNGWENIPSYNATFMSEDETLLSKGETGFAGFKGDICYYIDQNYRMPTRLELDSLKSYHKAFIGGAISESKADGTYEVTTQYATLAGIVFPASGLRHRTSGPLNSVGYGGYYWSGSAANGSYLAYYLTFSDTSGSFSTDKNTYKVYGLPVRCVKN